MSRANLHIVRRDFTPEELEVLAEAANRCDELNAEAEARYRQTHEDLNPTDWRSWRDTLADRLLLSEADMLGYPKPPVLVDGLLLAGTLAALVSEPGMGKSFVALDLALSVASRQPVFLGLPLRVHGPVVYVVGEGGGRFKLRLKAWKHHHQIDSSLGFHWVNGPVDLLDSAAVERLIHELRSVRPALLVIDTLSRCLVGADENSQQSMTQAVAALDAIRTSVDNLTVLVLHHTNASGSRERGSTVFRGAVDTQLRLRHPKKAGQTARAGATSADGEDEGNETTSGRIKLTVDKQKDLDELKPILLQKVEVTIPDECEEGGEPSTSLLWVRPDSALPLLDRVLAFVRAYPGATKNAIVTRLGAKRPAVLDAISTLEASGRITVEQHGREHRVYVVRAA